MQKLLTLIPTNNCSETCGCSLFLVTYTNSFIANQFAIMSSINQHKMSYNDFKYQIPDTPTAGNEKEEGASTSKSDPRDDSVRAMSSDDNKQASTNKRKSESSDAETTPIKKTKKLKTKNLPSWI